MAGNYRAPPQRRAASPQSIAPLKSLFRGIVSVLDAKDASFAGLTVAAGLDPARDFRNITLNGVPLEGQELSGYDFSGSDLRGTGIEKNDRKKLLRDNRFDGALNDGPSLDPHVMSFNQRLKALAYRDAENLMRDVLSGSSPRCDVISFTTLIKKSPSEKMAEHWFGEMTKAKIDPDVITYNTLVQKAVDGARREYWKAALEAARNAARENGTSSIFESH